MSYPVFASGDVLNASDMNAVGLWLIKTQTVGNGVSSVTVTGAFSSTYDHYRIIYAGGAASTISSIALQFGPSSVSGFNANYNSVLLYGAYAGGAAAVLASANATQFVYAGEGDATTNYVVLDVLNPNNAKNTQITGVLAGQNVMGSIGGIQKNNGQYTQFTLTPGAGTLTGGTIRVYGYRN